MGDIPTPRARALVRAAAEDILADDGRQNWQREVWERNYRQMARGTLAALDWLEGRRDTTPSTGEVRRPEDVLQPDAGSSWRPTALTLERMNTEDWGRGHIRPPTEDMHYHGAVWAVLRWWRSSDRARSQLAIIVPEVSEIPPGWSS